MLVRHHTFSLMYHILGRPTCPQSGPGSAADDVIRNTLPVIIFCSWSWVVIGIINIGLVEEQRLESSVPFTNFPLLSPLDLAVRMARWSHCVSILKTSLTVIFTLHIPSFYAARWEHFIQGDQPVQGLRYSLGTWKALRAFATLLLASMLTGLLRANADTGTLFRLFTTCSVILASMSVITSTMLIICFSQYPGGFTRENIDAMRFLLWNVWDLCAMPAIWTFWSMIAAIISIVDAVADPGIFQNNATSHPDCYYTVGRFSDIRGIDAPSPSQDL
ncbi:hypothetical protein AMATHDRAFT_39981 [Amanita thiersii Skay4041]|uniref:Uncharacterized protein n=1 Tax=Amanita thiersii Skay4041 TaxID=703135 RepID=A0A2A9NL50_9AGAR|nr:hypothetical protein AMATHDRAFT_39981 [Amanita thiersii Skay4041]